MLRFVVRRLLLLIPILFGSCRSCCSSGCAVSREGLPRPSWGSGQRQRSADRAALWAGPAVVRPVRQVLVRAQLDFGNSINTRRPVTEEMLRLWPATFELAIAH